MDLSFLAKMLLPGFLALFQIIFIILYGLLVRYDDGGAALTSNDTTVTDISQLDSSRNALKVYPRELVELRYLDLSCKIH